MSTENGLKTVRVTMNFLMGEFLPAMQGLMVERCSGKFGYALMKNFKASVELTEVIRQQRLAKMKEHCELDDQGAVKATAEEGKATMPIYKTKEDEEAYAKWEKEFAGTAEFELHLHAVEESELESISACTPALLMVMEPMLVKKLPSPVRLKTA